MASPTRWRKPFDSVAMIWSRDVAEQAELDRAVDRLAGAAAAHALEPSAVGEVLAHAHLGVERDVLGQVAELAAGLDRFALEVDAGEA